MGPNFSLSFLCFMRGRSFGAKCRFVVDISIDDFDVTKDFVS